MKKIHAILAVLSLVAFQACTKDIEASAGDEEESGVPMTFTITRDPETKALIDGTSVLWTAGEGISIIDGDYESSTSHHNRKFTAVSGGTKTTSFDGTCDDVASYYAISPYFKMQEIKNSQSSFNIFHLNTSTEGVLATLIPFRQKAVNGSFDPESLIMVGKSDPDNKLNISMKQLCGMIRFTLAGENIREIEFSGMNGEKICGLAVVTFNADGDPVLTDSDSYVSGFVKELFLQHVTLVPSEGNIILPGTYYICLPPTNFTKGIKLTFKKTDGTIAEKEGRSAINLTRAGIFDLGTIDTSALTWLDAVEIPFFLYPRQSAMKFPLSTASDVIKAPVYDGYYNITSWVSSSGSSTWWPSTDTQTAQNYRAKWLNQEVPVTVQSLPGGGTYTFKLFATSYISPHEINGMRMARKTSSDLCYILIPGIEGKKLVKLNVISGNTNKIKITDTSGQVVSGGAEVTLAYGDEKSFVLTGTESGASYRIFGASLNIKSIVAFFADGGAGVPVSADQSVTRTSADSFSASGQEALLKGAFSVRNGAGLYEGAVEFGFEYRAEDTDEWKSVTCTDAVTGLQTYVKSGVTYYLYNCRVTDMASAKDNRYRAWVKGNNDFTRTYGDVRTVYTSKKVMAIYFADNLAASDNWLAYLPTVNSKNSDGKYFNEITDLDLTFDSDWTFTFHGEEGLSKSTKDGGLKTTNIIFSPKSTTLNPVIGGSYRGYVKIPAVSGKKLTKVTVYSGSADKAGYQVTSDPEGTVSLTGANPVVLTSSSLALTLTGSADDTVYYLQVIPQNESTDINVSQLRFQFD